MSLTTITKTTTSTTDESDLARALYDDHPAALPLLRAAVHGPTLEARVRASRALQQLDPDNEVIIPDYWMEGLATQATARACRAINRVLEEAGCAS